MGVGAIRWGLSDVDVSWKIPLGQRWDRPIRLSVGTRRSVG